MTLRSTVLVAGAFASIGLASMESPAAAAEGCSVSAAANWAPAPGRIYRTEAFSNGPTCAQAVVTLVVRAPDGSVAWADAAPSKHVMTFAGVKARGAMARALADWLAQNAMLRTTADLPPWREGTDGPQSGEFPFMPETWVDRAYYERTRAAKLPLFTYVQGMESIACIVLSEDGQMLKIGVQTFPG